jgi:enamine deaminase RidA (YjgF/YER057c/UK114 family)
MSERQLISSGSPYEGVVGYSRAVRVGRQVFVAGTTARWPDGTIDPDPERQARRCIEIITEALAEAGASLSDVVRTRMFVPDPEDFSAIGKAHGEAFAAIRPANTTVVCQLLDPAWKVEIEVEAVLADRADQPAT